MSCYRFIYLQENWEFTRRAHRTFASYARSIYLALSVSNLLEPVLCEKICTRAYIHVCVMMRACVRVRGVCNFASTILNRSDCLPLSCGYM